MDPGLLQRLRDRRFYHGKIVNSRLRENEENDVAFVDLIDQHGLERALVSSFGFGGGIMPAVRVNFGESLQGHHHPDFELVLLDNYDRTTQNCGVQLLQERLVHVRPYFPTNSSNAHYGKYGLQHSKLMVLQYVLVL